MVFYRKYRPQKISDLDETAVRESLYSLFSKGFDGPHALLFSGPKGLGKTSAARIVAKVVNCEKQALSSKNKKQKTILSESDIEPDNKCGQCLSIASGTNFDILEIDGASNRGIDEIRDLREKINLLPTSASKKVYIIDEVHMLTTEAFNALLKTLEEPPAHALFILCTTEQNKLPQTIVSRCFKVDFKRATVEEIARSLYRIVKGEGIKADRGAILEIAKLSDGSFRDAAKILEEISLIAGRKNINAEIINEKYSTLDLEKIGSLILDSFAKKDTKLGFDIISKAEKQGIEFRYLIEYLLSKLHLMLIEKLSGKEGINFEVYQIKELLELLSKAHSETKFSVIQQLPLELALVEWSENSSSVVSASDSLVMADEQLKHKAPGGTLASPKVDDFEKNFINEVKMHNHLIAGVLRSCNIENANNSLKIIAISKFHKEKLEEDKTIEILEEVARKLNGKKVKIDIMFRG